MSLVEHKYRCKPGGDSGTWALTIMVDTASTSATGVLLDVLVLHEIEPLTRSLEDATQQVVHWLPAGQSEAATSTTYLIADLVVNDAQLVRGVCLQCPTGDMALLRHWQQLRIDQGIELAWRLHPCSLRLSETSLSVSELSALGDGALYVIAESYEPEWMSALDLGGDNGLIPGRFDYSGDRWSPIESKIAISRKQANDATDSESVDLADSTLELTSDTSCWVELACELDPDQLLCDDAGFNTGLADRARDSKLVFSREGQHVYYGALLPLGGGHALLLEQPSDTGWT